MNIEMFLKEAYEDARKVMELSKRSPEISRKVYLMMQDGTTFDDALEQLGASSLMNKMGPPPVVSKTFPKPDPNLPPRSRVTNAPPQAQQQTQVSRPSMPNPELSNVDLSNPLAPGEQEKARGALAHHKKFGSNPKYQEWLKKQPPSYLQMIQKEQERQSKLPVQGEGKK